MKKLLYIVLLFQACTALNKQTSDVQVIIDPNPAQINEIAIVRLSIEHKEGVFPDFYIVHKGDTGLLDFNSVEDYAFLELVNNRAGNYSYHGFVNYTDNESVEQTAHYTIDFTVAE